MLVTDKFEIKRKALNGIRDAKERRRRLAEMSVEFRDALAATYAPKLPPNVTNKLFELAWQEGHSNGYNEVEIYYDMMLTLAEMAYTAGYTAGQFDEELASAVVPR